jgi:hypothetical protein
MEVHDDGVYGVVVLLCIKKNIPNGGGASLGENSKDDRDVEWEGVTK